MDERYLETVKIFDSKFTVEETYSHSELRSFIENEETFVGKNVAAYSYNRWNKGMSVIYPVLEWVNRGEYKYLGGNYPYDGIIIHHPQGGVPYKIGIWNKGVYQLYNGHKSFRDWKESLDEGIKTIDLNSKVIFESVDGKIIQKKVLIDKETEEIEFVSGYSVTYFESTLGKILRFKEEGDLFEFGKNKYKIVSIS